MTDRGRAEPERVSECDYFVMNVEYRDIADND